MIDHFHLVGVHAEHDEVFVSGASTTFAEGEVVFLGATGVAVAFDAHADAGIGLHELSLLAEHVAGFGLDVGLVKVEVHDAVGDRLSGAFDSGVSSAVVVGGGGGSHVSASLLFRATKASTHSHNESHNESQTFESVHLFFLLSEFPRTEKRLIKFLLPCVYYPAHARAEGYSGKPVLSSW